MAAHASDLGDSLNQCRRGGKRLTMVMMFVGGVVSVLDGIPVLFLPYKTYRVGVFRSPPNPMRGIPVNSLMTSLITHSFLTTTNTKAG